MHKISMVI